MLGKVLSISVIYICICGYGVESIYSMARLSVSRKSHSSPTVCPPTPCDVRNCPVVTVDTCSGRIMPDECGCCPVCNMTAGNITAVTDVTPAEDADPEACKQMECPKQQMCLLNIQGIPVCRCPSSIYCRSRPRKEVCSKEGKTYRSLCYLKMQACDENRKIAISHKGPCEGAKEAMRQKRIERRKEKQEKKEKRMEKKKKREEKVARKEKKQERLEKQEMKRKNQEARQQKRKDKQNKERQGNGKRKVIVDKNTDRKKDRKERKEELREERRRHRRRLRKIMNNNNQN